MIGGKTADRPADRTGRGGEKRIETGRRKRIETGRWERIETGRQETGRDRETGNG